MLELRVGNAIGFEKPLSSQEVYDLFMRAVGSRGYRWSLEGVEGAAYTPETPKSHMIVWPEDKDGTITRGSEPRISVKVARHLSDFEGWDPLTAYFRAIALYVSSEEQLRYMDTSELQQYVDELAGYFRSALEEMRLDDAETEPAGTPETS